MGEFKAGGRHGAVRTVLLKTMTSILHRERPGTATVMQHEPYVTQHLTWEPKAPPGQLAHSVALKRRADIGYTLHEPDKPPIIKGVDLVITHANPRRSSGPEAANFPGIAALKVHELKIKSYDKDFVVPVGRLIPFAVETGGRLSSKSRLFLATFVRKDAMGLATEDGMSAEERTKYNAYLRELIEAVGITLAKATAGALLWNSGGRLPCPRTGLLSGPAAPCCSRGWTRGTVAPLRLWMPLVLLAPSNNRPDAPLYRERQGVINSQACRSRVGGSIRFSRFLP